MVLFYVQNSKSSLMVRNPVPEIILILSYVLPNRATGANRHLPECLALLVNTLKVTSRRLPSFSSQKLVRQIFAIGTGEGISQRHSVQIALVSPILKACCAASTQLSVCREV